MTDRWDNDASTVAGELRELLATMKDEGTHIDSGGGDGVADLWVTIGGIEYAITVKKSRVVAR